MITLTHVPRGTHLWRWAAGFVTAYHYLHTMPDPRSTPETFIVRLRSDPDSLAGVLVFSRPEATRCADWYGSVDDVDAGRCDSTRWQVLNLARVWIAPSYQTGGQLCTADYVPGYTDRRGRFRSTLASTILRTAIGQIGYEYLRLRPPCFLEEPYRIRWLLSYCDTRLHRGVIYAASGFDLYKTNPKGIQTWRIRLPDLTAQQDANIRSIAATHPRSVAYRGKRAQMALGI